MGGKMRITIWDKCRCNMCMGIYDEEVLECPKCKTDQYLMQPFEQEVKNETIQRT